MCWSSSGRGRTSWDDFLHRDIDRKSLEARQDQRLERDELAAEGPSFDIPGGPRRLDAEHQSGGKDLLDEIPHCADRFVRSEEHTSELQSLMRISYAVFCLKKKKHTKQYSSHRSKMEQYRV